MPSSDLDIQRTAHLWIQQHGDEALPKARAMVEKMRCRGDKDGADVWLRIIEAIVMLGEPLTEARTMSSASPARATFPGAGIISQLLCAQALDLAAGARIVRQHLNAAAQE